MTPGCAAALQSALAQLEQIQLHLQAMQDQVQQAITKTPRSAKGNLAANSAKRTAFNLPAASSLASNSGKDMPTGRTGSTPRLGS